ncbi:hypothetical protein NRU72_000656 [Listeria monocytogenes]|nr:hypothetical protein [Listeria monocytogenes]
MKIDNQGYVVRPQNYYMWYAELTGNTDDTGGIYVFILPPNNEARSISFWDTNLNGVLQQLEGQNIVITWEKEIQDNRTYGK